MALLLLFWLFWQDLLNACIARNRQIKHTHIWIYQCFIKEEIFIFCLLINYVLVDVKF